MMDTIDVKPILYRVLFRRGGPDFAQFSVHSGNDGIHVVYYGGRGFDSVEAL